MKTERYLIERSEYVIEKIAEADRVVYHQEMPAHNKAAYRRVLELEYDHEMRQMVRQDNNTGRDDQ